MIDDIKRLLDPQTTWVRSHTNSTILVGTKHPKRDEVEKIAKLLRDAGYELTVGNFTIELSKRSGGRKPNQHQT
jgi:hypothetical protein